ncbi:MAG: hypothetical protein HY300_13480, partial [Verrucomicrobia bacterium]|nr:hypothetical protein [Verrucomicrobiota bacterium]
MRILKFVFAALAFSLAATVVTAQENKDAPKKAAPKAQAKSNRPTSTKWDTTDLGQFFSSGLEAPAPDGKGRVRPALKAVSIKVGPNDEATMCFDTERLRMAVGWSGGFLKLPTGREGLEGVPQPVGEIAFSSAAQPGWANASGSFDEPNPPKRDGNELVSFGPLPREWAKWRGLYLNGKQVVLSYTVGKAGVLELPGYDAEKKIFTRSFEVKDSSAPITLLVCEDAKAAGGMEGETAVLTSGERCVAVHYSGRAKASLEVKDGRVLAKLPALGKTELFKISLWSGAKAELPAALAALKAGTPITNPAVLTKGGPARWNPVIETKGELGAGDAPYVVDTLTLPDENPWNSWLRTSGFDFFKDATRAAVCTVNGEVWIVGGIDEKLEHLKWKRFATGLFQPLG